METGHDAPSVDSLSPFGGLETLWTWLTTGEILKHLHRSDLVLLLASVQVALLLGGAFCGWICPFGALQEWLYRLRAHFLPYQVKIFSLSAPSASTPAHLAPSWGWRTSWRR